MLRLEEVLPQRSAEHTPQPGHPSSEAPIPDPQPWIPKTTADCLEASLQADRCLVLRLEEVLPRPAEHTPHPITQGNELQL